MPPLQACTTTLTTMAGQVSGLPGLPINTLCPPGSYYVKDEYCYKWCAAFSGCLDMNGMEPVAVAPAAAPAAGAAAAAVL